MTTKTEEKGSGKGKKQSEKGRRGGFPTQGGEEWGKKKNSQGPLAQGEIEERPEKRGKWQGAEGGKYPSRGKKGSVCYCLNARIIFGKPAKRGWLGRIDLDRNNPVKERV